jgi:Zn finger protein HypA/HybF involved in hydrogenase expression
MRLLWCLLLAPLVAGSCVKTDDASLQQCRDLQTKNQQQTVGRVCVQAGDLPDTLKVVFDTASEEWTLEWARASIGPTEEMESLGSAPIATVVSSPTPKQEQWSQLQRNEKEMLSSLEIFYQTDTPFLTCPSCHNLELQVIAAASVRNNATDESLTVYGYEEDNSSFLSYVFGDYWVVKATATVVDESAPFDGFPIQMTCDCDESAKGRLLRKGRRRRL